MRDIVMGLQASKSELSGYFTEKLVLKTEGGNDPNRITNGQFRKVRVIEWVLCLRT